MSSWEVVAQNLPEHGHNPIHTDEGARAAGFERALVAGVTSYAYCCHCVIERFGLEWLGRGEAALRLRAPVFAGDRLHIEVEEREDGGLDLAAFAERAESALVEVSAWPDAVTSYVEQPGEPLPTVELSLDKDYGADYAERAGDPRSFTPAARLVHPAVWPAIANSVFQAELARGAWVHTRSRIWHHSAVRAGAEAAVSTVVVERFRRGGERAVADVEIRVDGEVVARVEHEAIVDLAPDDAG